MNNVYKTSFQLRAKRNNSPKLNFHKTDSSFQISPKINDYSNVNFEKTNSNFKVQSALDSTDKEIFYDDIIYYDGGDVHGYGDDA